MGGFRATDSEGNQPPAGLARDLSVLAREMQAAATSADTLDRIVDAAVAHIPGVTAAGITVASAHRMHTAASSDDIVERIDQIQYDTRQGPCMEAAWVHHTIRCDDLTTELRWPIFAACAAELGIRSVLAVQLFVASDSLGALNLYSVKPAAFDRESESVALMFGAHAAVAIAASSKQDNLRIALASREVIGEAKGILMERFKVGSQDAFDLLVMASQRSHRKLRDVAEELTRTGELADRKG